MTKAIESESLLTENPPGLAAPCEFLEGHDFSYGRGDFHPCGFPTKDRPYCDRSDEVCLRDVGIPLGPGIYLRVHLPYGFERALIVISCRDMTGAFELISIACFLSFAGLSSTRVERPPGTLLL